MKPLPADIVACPDCDLLQRVPSLPPGGIARCPRCRCLLASGKPGSHDRTTALASAALIVFVLANTQPLMKLSISGREVTTTVLGSAVELWRNGEPVSAVLVALFAVFAPLLYIGAMLAVQLATRRPPGPRWAGELLRWAQLSELWSMAEVMLLGLLVALVKITSLASVEPAPGIFGVGALVLLLAAISVAFDPRDAWARVRWANGKGPPEADR